MKKRSATSLMRVSLINRHSVIRPWISYSRKKSINRVRKKETQRTRDRAWLRWRRPRNLKETSLQLRRKRFRREILIKHRNWKTFNNLKTTLTTRSCLIIHLNSYAISAFKNYLMLSLCHVVMVVYAFCVPLLCPSSLVIVTFVVKK